MSTPNINQFRQSPVQGQLDMMLNMNTISCLVDPDESAALVAGQAVKRVDVAGGVPIVTACTADEDDVFGFVEYDIKNADFPADSMVNISAFAGNVMYMTSGEAIAANGEVMIDVAAKKVVAATSTNRIVGRAFDKASAADQLIRVYINLPGALKA